jgi:hypothetical protein
LLGAAGCDLNHTNRSSNSTPMHNAARHGHLKIVQFLLRNDADPNKLSTSGCTIKNKTQRRQQENNQKIDGYMICSAEELIRRDCLAQGPHCTLHATKQAQARLPREKWPSGCCVNQRCAAIFLTFVIISDPFFILSLPIFVCLGEGKEIKSSYLQQAAAGAHEAKMNTCRISYFLKKF